VNDTTLRMSRRRKSPGNQKNGQSNCVTQWWTAPDRMIHIISQ
jgi:hypothetical protein